MAGVNSSWDKWSIGELEFESFIDLDAKIDGQILSEQIEKGSYASYNKVMSPIELTLTVAQSGEADVLQNMIDKLVDMRASTELFSVVTPEYEYENMSLESFSYSRKREDGLNLLTVEVRCIEVKEVESQTTNVAIKKSAAKNKESTSKAANGKTSADDKGSYRKSVLRSVGDWSRGG